MAPHAVEEGGDDPTLVAAPAGPVTTIDEVVARMQAISAALDPADGVACFNRMYLTVTVLVRERITAGFFADADAMQALDVTFANLYFAAADADAAGTPVPRAWRPLFERRADRHVEPVQFAFAGMNAHINHDLPVAVVATCSELRTAPDAGTFHADYQKVDALLAAIEPQVRQSFLPGLSAIDHVGNWSIDAARDAAWANALVLWHVRDVRPVRDAFLDALAGSVALASATLLTPLRP